MKLKGTFYSFALCPPCRRTPLFWLTGDRFVPVAKVAGHITQIIPLHNVVLTIIRPWQCTGTSLPKMNAATAASLVLAQDQEHLASCDVLRHIRGPHPDHKIC